MTQRPRGTSRRSLRVVACLTLAGLGLAPALLGNAAANASVSHALIQGSGSSWAANAVNQWVADVQSQEGMQVVFNPERRLCRSAPTSPARPPTSPITSIGYQGKDPLTGTSTTPRRARPVRLPPDRCGRYGIPVPDQGPWRADQVTNLRLSGETLDQASSPTRSPTGTTPRDHRRTTTASPAAERCKIIPVVQSEGSGCHRSADAVLRQASTRRIWKPLQQGCIDKSRRSTSRGRAAQVAEPTAQTVP